ncbi:outer membrane beta-barrel protein [Dysgonomonas sp. ZJ709]|uniref:outer membrane beta-barrel protein n=1 Tax=Dysgonomonas sp. ZJ709 TaxID=2709797 RepID=UPI0013ED21F3|nr:outer membrane beta-barrel protein [Dysgonomonas sp. ZJ709]
MRKLFLVAILALVTFINASAQDVGQMWVGGSASLWSSKDKGTDESQTSYSILPEFGYVISKNIGIGIVVGYRHEEFASYSYINNMEQIETVATESYVINPFVRYSFLKGDIGGLFVDGGILYAHSKQKEYDVTSHQIEVGFRPGVAINVSSKVSLLGKFGFLGYQNDKSKYGLSDYKNERTTNGFGFKLNMNNVLLGMILKF